MQSGTDVKKEPFPIIVERAGTLLHGQEAVED
jgi:hypothetical protein